MAAKVRAGSLLHPKKPVPAPRAEHRAGTAAEALEHRTLLAFVAHVNFQTSSAAVPAGYVADSGYAFGLRGNGMTFGWNAANRDGARDRNSSRSPDQRYDTLNHLQKPENPNASWAIAVPNGAYSVRLVAGDPWHADSVY